MLDRNNGTAQAPEITEICALASRAMNLEIDLGIIWAKLKALPLAPRVPYKIGQKTARIVVAHDRAV